MPEKLKEQRSAKGDVRIIYEDEDIVVIDKPVGMLVHQDGRTKSKTVADWFVGRVPDAAGVGEPQILQDGTVAERPGIVHRLDRETSGVMVLAKTSAAHTHLKRQFHDRLAKKEYRAFVYGAMKEQRGTIDRPIGRSATDPRKRSAERGSRGTRRQAVTDWEMLAQNKAYAYLKLVPRTGRTHQLRVHLKAIGRPIVGDTLYANNMVLADESSHTQRIRLDEALGIRRLALHSYELTLTLPSGEVKTFTAPLPRSFARAKAYLIRGA